MLKKKSLLFLIAFSLLLFLQPFLSAGIENSVIKIYCVSQSYMFNRPWKKTNVSAGTGTGFIIDGDRIVTNAHVVSNARYIEVQAFHSSDKYIAKVKYISHISDLAILTVKDKRFYKGLQPLSFGPLPVLNSEVTTYGYPMGGLQLSVTRGVVSRIEMTTYVHSGVDQHLAIQTDAAINPGNSGGPVIQNGKVIGVAFQGLSQADNVGYMIPAVVVRQFLDDIEDGKVDGFSELALQYTTYCQNPTFRKLIGLPDSLSGVLVTKLYPNMPSYTKLKPLDVIVSINGKKITDDGFIFMGGRKFNFLEIVERIKVGDLIHLEVWRDRKKIKVDIKATKWTMKIPARNPYDVVPKYYIFGGLAFTTFSKGYIMASGGWKSLPLDLRQLYIQAQTEEKYADYQNFAVLTQRLPDKINVNMERYVGQVVQSVDGEPVYSLKDLKTKLITSSHDLIEIRFIGDDVPLIMSKKDALGKADEILQKYHIYSSERL